MKNLVREKLARFAALAEIPAADPAQLVRRIRIFEMDIMLPLKAAAFVMMFLSVYFKEWSGIIAKLLNVTPEIAASFFLLYLLGNIIVAGLLMYSRRLPLAFVQWAVVASSFMDAVFLAGLTLLTGGYDSLVFWIFVGLTIRNAIGVPHGKQQIILNITASLLYAAAAYLGAALSDRIFDEHTRQVLRLTPPEDVPAPLFVRLLVLWLTTALCHGVQIIVENQRLAIEEAREFAMREGQLRSAGRLAAQIAHQIKNPLAIINNTAFSLKRAMKEAKPETLQKVDIIQEEISRADKIITELMGYARLSEGRVEKLSVMEELDLAAEEVFPRGTLPKIHFHRSYNGHFPPLLMQKRHLNEVVTNLLQNARDALGESGNVTLAAQTLSNHSVEISIEDNGPGIPPEKLTQIFEPYYTTKERGTGLGLAIVKQNVELYGGSVRVESELGKGARFTLVFPAKALMKFGS